MMIDKCWITLYVNLGRNSDYSKKWVALESPRGYLREFLVVEGAPGSPNPDSISDQTMSFPTPVFRPGLKGKNLCFFYDFWFLTFKCKRKISNSQFHLLIKTTNMFSYTPVVPSQSIPYSRPKRRKNHTLWGGMNTSNVMAYVREYSPPPPLPPAPPQSARQVWCLQSLF